MKISNNDSSKSSKNSEEKQEGKLKNVSQDKIRRSRKLVPRLGIRNPKGKHHPAILKFGGYTNGKGSV